MDGSPEEENDAPMTMNNSRLQSSPAPETQREKEGRLRSEIDRHIAEGTFPTKEEFTNLFAIADTLPLCNVSVDDTCGGVVVALERLFKASEQSETDTVQFPTNTQPEEHTVVREVA